MSVLLCVMMENIIMCCLNVVLGCKIVEIVCGCKDSVDANGVAASASRSSAKSEYGVDVMMFDVDKVLLICVFDIVGVMFV